ncbi:MAG: class B sortase [Lachnospiraceae bacterium]|nr:class B sortase [Lachnospiraceae bacterium]
METEKKGKKERNTDRMLLVMGVGFLVLFLVAGGFLLRYYIAYREQLEADQEVANVRLRLSGSDYDDLKVGTWEPMGPEEAARSAQELRRLNPDYVLFLTIPGTPIYYPVVHRDNSYYLHHNFMQETNSHGAIFLDENCEPEDDVLLIHGHHMRDGTMFAELRQFRNKEFREAVPYIYLDFGEGDMPYEVFAVALVDLTGESYFHYEEVPDTKEEREEYLKGFKRSSVWFSGTIDGERLAGTNQLVFLSTCEYGTDNQRLILAAVAVE